MSFTQFCHDCRNAIPPSASKCPHCGRPGIFPNVNIAIYEQSALETRYKKEIENAKSSGLIANVEDFERAANKSCAVISRSLDELQRVAGSDNQLYATYYELGAIRMPSGEDWDSRRQVADFIFFTDYQREIRFAALSLDSVGLSNYGDCSWVLREEMIAHRTSVFEMNTTIFVREKKITGADELPKGYRAIWDDRAKLCVTKLAKKINSKTKPNEYQYLLLYQGATPAEDDFVEVHIFGPMTIRTIEEVTFKPLPATLDKKNRNIKIRQIEGIKEKLEKYGVKVN